MVRREPVGPRGARSRGFEELAASSPESDDFAESPSQGFAGREAVRGEHVGLFGSRKDTQQKAADGLAAKAFKQAVSTTGPSK